MSNWKEALVNPETPIIDSIRIIDGAALQIALVVDEHNRLMGTVTDGDIRRAILRGVSLESPVKYIMHANPVKSHVSDKKQAILAMMRNKGLRHIPVLDDEGRIARIEILDELIQSHTRHNWVVLMAGGLGTRLSPMTDSCPKPLLKVGTKPILETILDNFIEHGFYRFYLSVNYRADMIRDYFGDGAKWGVEIRYIHESQRLGTAGALSLIHEPPSEDMIVMNGDLLTKVNFQQLLDFHKQTNASATMCVREFEYQVPYGVVQVDQHRLTSIVEKPTERYFVNGGIYVLSPEMLRHVPKETFFDMPSLFEQAIAHQMGASVFPIREYWIDIGRMDDYNRANDEFQERFV